MGNPAPKCLNDCPRTTQQVAASGPELYTASNEPGMLFYKLPNSPAQLANHLNRDPDWTAEPPNAIHSKSRHQSYSRTEHPLFVITLSKALS